MQTLQELILRLSEFWARQGGVLQQPLELEVGEDRLQDKRPHVVARGELVLGDRELRTDLVGEDLGELVRRHHFQLRVGAVARPLVAAPAAEVSRGAVGGPAGGGTDGRCGLR